MKNNRVQIYKKNLITPYILERKFQIYPNSNYFEIHFDGEKTLFIFEKPLTRVGADYEM